MGTSTASSDLHSDKLAKLQARKKELEILLAAKNEDLYKLCVQEVKLTGIMPPEAPLEASEVASDGLADRRDESAPRRDSADSSHSRRSRQSYRQDKSKDAEAVARIQIAHRLSTPSASGASSKSLSSPLRRDYASANHVSLAHDSRDSFSMHSSQTYPTLQPAPERALREPRRAPEPAGYSRHHCITTEHVSRLQYGPQAEAHGFSRVHETHFSSSHPDITSHYSHSLLTAAPATGPGPTPLLYQYASQLRARSQHLGPAGPAARRRDARRHTLQRTQTYHLTAPSDYGLGATESQPPTPRRHRAERVPTSIAQNYISQPLLPVQSTSSSSRLPLLNDNSTHSLYCNQFGEAQDLKVKEKEWYESSLDSPSGAGLNLSRESIQYSPKKPLQRTPSVLQSPSNSTVDGIAMTVNDCGSVVQSVAGSQASLSPQSPQVPSHVPFESPKNLTVVESGKWIPYREVTKPFEMSDFYKYSTKFRQGNNNINSKPKLSAPPPGVPTNYSPVEDVHSYSNQEPWRHAN